MSGLGFAALEQDGVWLWFRVCVTHDDPGLAKYGLLFRARVLLCFRYRGGLAIRLGFGCI